MTGFTQITVVPPLDFTNEQLVVGDTSAHVSKMNSYMTKIQLWANDFAASIESMNALGGELASAETSNTVAITTLQNEIAEKLDSANTALNQMSEIAEAIVSLQSSFSNLGINDVSDLSNQLNASNQEILSEATTRASAILAEATARAYSINLEKVARENADGIESDARIEADNALSARLQIIEDIEQLDEGAVSQALADVNALLAQLGPSPSIQNVAGLQEALDAKVERASLNLDAILLAKDIGPVDVFIYDTKNDSDGGAWPRRVHSEDVPSLLIGIAETSALTVLNGDESDNPVWKVYDFMGEVIKSVAALGGMISIATDSGLTQINLVTSSREQYTTSTSLAIVNDTCNGVAMTVLEAAQLDLSTGLPVITTALGTDGGVSIINGPAGVGTVVNWTRSVYGPICSILSFREDGALIASFDVTASLGRFKHVLHTLPTVDIVDTHAYIKGSSDEFYPMLPRSAYSGTSLPLSHLGSLYSVNTIGTSGSEMADAGNSQLTLIHPNPSDPTKGMTCAITSKYNTGWMVGDTKLVALCSTDDSDLVGGTDDDRSVNNNPLTVNGTINRTKRHPDSDMVAYSGATINDYLELTHSSIVDTLYGYCWVETATDVWELQHGLMSTNPIDDITIVGNTLTIGLTKAKLPLRLTGTTPSNHQIIKIDYDEGAMINACLAGKANATLFGTSDDVKAVSFDPVTELLRAPTSQGVNVFDGLARIDNTTDNINYIAAHDGLVVGGSA